MAYRRTERVMRRLAARHDAILSAAESAVAEGGMAAVQIAAVAERAGIAAGTVYRYFPSKADLVNDLIEQMCAREIGAVQEAAQAAPGPLSAIAAAVATFGQRALTNRRLAWALIAEPADADASAARSSFRQALAAELEELIGAAASAGLLPSEQEARAAVPALVGALLEGLIGPLAPECEAATARRAAVQSLTLLVLRALGVADARARGLVVQVPLPSPAEWSLAPSRCSR
jgi:AcrR family transcriptional regulator